MILEITPAPFVGTVNAINSKSELHRLLICAALADAPCTLILGNPTDALSNDIKATIDCLIALGANIETTDTEIRVTPIKTVPEHPVLDCKESGSTLRFLMPVATALCDEVTFKGNERLSERPIGSLKNALESHGVTFSSDNVPFTCRGKLQPGKFEVTGDLSSQYVSGLLLSVQRGINERIAFILQLEREKIRPVFQQLQKDLISLPLPERAVFVLPDPGKLAFITVGQFAREAVRRKKVHILRLVDIRDKCHDPPVPVLCQGKARFFPYLP